MALALAVRRLSSSIDKPIKRLQNGGSLYYMSSLPNEAVYEKEKNGFTWPKQLNAPLEVIDPEIADIIDLEKARQWKSFERGLGEEKKKGEVGSLLWGDSLLVREQMQYSLGLELIPSENFTSVSVMQAITSLIWKKTNNFLKLLKKA